MPPPKNKSKYAAVLTAVRQFKRAGQEASFPIPKDVHQPATYMNRLNAALRRNGILPCPWPGLTLRRRVVGRKVVIWMAASN